MITAASSGDNEEQQQFTVSSLRTVSSRPAWCVCKSFLSVTHRKTSDSNVVVRTITHVSGVRNNVGYGSSLLLTAATCFHRHWLTCIDFLTPYLKSAAWCSLLWNRMSKVTSRPIMFSIAGFTTVWKSLAECKSSSMLLTCNTSTGSSCPSFEFTVCCYGNTCCWRLPCTFPPAGPVAPVWSRTAELGQKVAACRQNLALWNVLEND